MAHAGFAFRTVTVWALVLALAVLNGALREAVLVPQLGNPAGQMISGILLIACIAVVTMLASPWLDARSRRQRLVVGFSWLLLTLVFEFTFGIARGKPMQEILDAYTFTEGNLWPLVLVATCLAPMLLARPGSNEARFVPRSPEPGVPEQGSLFNVKNQAAPTAGE